MFSLEKANMPAATKMNRPASTSGRRVSPNCSTLRSTLFFQSAVKDKPAGTRSVRCGGQRVAQEYRAFGGNKFAGLRPTEDLPVATAFLPDFDDALDKAAAVGRDPCRHRAVALAHHAVERDRGRAHRRADSYGEIREHSGTQLVLRVLDFRAHRHTTCIRVHCRADCRDRTVER